MHRIGIFLAAFCVALAWTLLGPSADAQSFPAGCTATTCTGSVLPSGFLSVAADQFVTGGNALVRLSCADFTGSPNDGTMPAVRAAGFNCIRIGWRDQILNETGPTGTIFDDEFTALSLHSPWQTGDNWQLIAPNNNNGRGGTAFNEPGHQWWTNPLNPSTPIPGGTSGPTPPAVASAAGYTRLTYGPNVTLGSNWFITSGCAATQNANGSVTDSLGGTPANCNTFNNHVQTTSNPGGTAGGTAFNGGGYIEAVFSFANPPSVGCGGGTNGWPSFWMNALESDHPNNVPAITNDQNLEYDTSEWCNVSSNSFNSGVIHWYGGAGLNYNNCSLPGGCGNAQVVLPGGFDPTQRHKYAFLWIPATNTTQGSLQLYVDDVARGMQWTWNKYGGGSTPNTPTDPPWSIMDVQHSRLIFGSSSNNPMTVYSVSVWQNPNVTTNFGPINPLTASAGPLYTVDANGLNLELLPLPAADQAYVNAQCACTNLTYAGAMLNGSKSYIRTFGYTEMSIAVDRLNGFGFIADQKASPLAPVYPPDIIWPEIWTDSGGVQHVKGDVKGTNGSYLTYTTDSGAGFDARQFHTYGVDWEQNFITLYLDGIQVGQVATPTADHYKDNTQMFWYLQTTANYFGEGDPTPASLPQSAHVKYFRTYASRPGTVSTGTCGTLAEMQICVQNAQNAGLAVIFSHMGNEIPTTSNSPCWNRQQNGLWFDNGGSSGNDDGCGDGSNVSYATFKANTVKLMQQFVGNTNVIGYEFHHEPVVIGCATSCSGATGVPNPPINWGGGGDTDIRAACQDVGKTVFAINPGPILFCPGPINNSATLFNGTSRGSMNPHQDLSVAAALPVATTGLPANKVAYSVDEFPNSVTGYTGTDNGAAAITAYNAFWGSLLINHTAPVMNMWLGCSCDNSNGAGTADNAWAATIRSYTNGLASGGPQWPAGRQAMSTAWRSWGHLTTNPNGTLLADNVTLNTAQDPYWSTFLYSASSTPPPPSLTTWNPSDLQNVTLSGNNLVATSTSAATIFINGGTVASFSDSFGNVWSTDGELNAYETPSGGSIIALGGKNPIGFFAGQMALANNTAYIQDSRNGNWYTINPTTQVFTGPVAAPPLGQSTVRSITSKSSGKVCWEVTASTITTNWNAGLANSAFVLNGSAALGGDNNGIGFSPNATGNNQAIIFGNATLSHAAGAAVSSNGDVIAQCADFGAGLFWSTSTAMRTAAGAGSWNNSNTCNPTVAACGISTSGMTCPCFVAFNELQASGVGTLNTGALLSVAMPSGFSQWDTTVARSSPFILIFGDNDNWRHANDDDRALASFKIGDRQ